MPQVLWNKARETRYVPDAKLMKSEIKNGKLFLYHPESFKYRVDYSFFHSQLVLVAVGISFEEIDREILNILCLTHSVYHLDVFDLRLIDPPYLR